MNILDSLTEKVLSTPPQMSVMEACEIYMREQEQQKEPIIYSSLTNKTTQKEFADAVKSLSDSYLVTTVEIVKA